MSAPTRAQVLGRIAETLTTHESVVNAEWVALSLVACRRPGRNRAHRMYGYLYLVDGTTTDLEIDFRALRSRYTELIAVTVAADEPGWQKCLLQLENAGQSKVQMEYEDERRWTLDATDFDKLALELRPNFDAPAT